MRRTTRSVSIVIAAAVFTCLVAWTQGDTQKWIIEPGKVEVKRHETPSKGRPAPLDPPQVSGSFKRVASPTGAESQTGGGCLIFLPAQRTTCTNDAICGAGGYCSTTQNPEDAASGGNSVPNTRACWYRPNPESCVRSQNAPVSLTDVELPWISAYPPNTGRPVPWRVVTCQNLTPVGAPVPGCKSTDAQKKKLQFGQIRFVP